MLTKIFLHIGKSFHDSSVDVTFRIVKLTYKPDFDEKYFYKHFDTSTYQDPPTDDTLYEYTSAVGLLSDPDIVFTPASPHHSVCPGLSAPTPINLVTVDYVNPNTKVTHLFHRPPRSRITRAQYFKGKQLLLYLTKTIKKYQINSGSPPHIQASPHTSQT